MHELSSIKMVEPVDKSW